MDEERPCVQKLMPVKLLPFISPGPSLIALFGQRVRRRGETEDVKKEGFVVALPPILDESIFRSPAVRDRVLPSEAGPLGTSDDSIVLGPLPVGPGVEGLGKCANLALIVSVAIEILRGRQSSRDQERRIDG